ncbi:MAG: hypothetical protein COA89_06180 [Acidithiobacillus sp.]|nr:MAG: hypothetical protein COA89_06180 [Acidithiobacillus sp.]HHZ71851.1 hypothetical protein [Gammaproteobacteria bacterium]
MTSGSTILISKIRRSLFLRLRRIHLAPSFHLSKRALNALTEQLRAPGKVVQLADRPIFCVNRWTEWNRFTKLNDDCGIDGLRFHDLRHEATSRLFESGFNVIEVASITGHVTQWVGSVPLTRPHEAANRS